jgi:hypothetical protein
LKFYNRIQRSTKGTSIGTNNPNLVKLIVYIKEEADKIDMIKPKISQDQALERIRNGMKTLRCNYYLLKFKFF